MNLRARRDGDDERIAFIVRRAFGGQGEVDLVAALRSEGAMACEFVAERDGHGLIGHIAFSRLDMRSTDRQLEAVALAPLAVLPTHQRQGAGSALVEFGLAHLRARSVDIAVVLGEPAYYSRFGFSALLARLLHAPYSGEAFQALELAPGVLGKHSWDVAYPAPFARLA